MRLPSFTRPVTGARTRLVCGATFAFALAAGASVWAAFSGAIYTSEADGTRVNQNLYDSKPLVYLNGGPQNQNGSGLPDGRLFLLRHRSQRRHAAVDGSQPSVVNSW